MACGIADAAAERNEEALATGQNRLLYGDAVQGRGIRCGARHRPNHLLEVADTQGGDDARRRDQDRHGDWYHR